MPDDLESESASLTDLETRLQQARGKISERTHSSADKISGQRRGSDMGVGFRIVVELLAAIGVSIALGILLDRWWGTSPLMIIIMALLGFASGTYTVYRTATNLEKQRKVQAGVQDKKNDS